MGMRPPEEETIEERKEYFDRIMQNYCRLPSYPILMAAQELDFAAI